MAGRERGRAVTRTVVERAVYYAWQHLRIGKPQRSLPRADAEEVRAAGGPRVLLRLVHIGHERGAGEPADEDHRRE